MRILHIVTLVTPDGAGGGPVRVAFNLVREIQARGHEVVIVGAARGYDPIPTRIGDVSVRLSKARQLVPSEFVGIFAPSMLLWMCRHGRVFDVVHVHMGRDMVTLPAAALALLLRKRVVIQTHGMVDISDHPLAPLLDRLLTGPVLRRADVVLFLTKQERLDLLQVGGDGIVPRELPNGVPVSEIAPRDGSTPNKLEVLFLARLHERKRPQLFVAAAATLLSEGIEATFVLVGPDEGEGSEVTRAIAELGDNASSVTWEGALPPQETVERMRKSSIYVLPSVNEPFPMSVLEAMSVGLPVIMTESCGLADTIRESRSGIVVDETKGSLIEAMRQLLLDSRLREEMGRAAHNTALKLFGMEAVGSALLDMYNDEDVRTVERQRQRVEGV
jgi:glycosyltransferase involved in cell wall biosynthesis